MKKNKTVIILGMHRSATSLVAKGLSTIVNLGKRLMGAGRGNEQGHYEDYDFYELNHKILEESGGHWDRPPKELTNDLDDEVKQLIDRKIEENDGIWGWKDPRTVLTIDKYIKHLDDPIIVAVFRKPEKCAESLTKRDKTNYELNLRLVNYYNAKLIEFLAKNYAHDTTKRSRNTKTNTKG